ncbi:MAG: RHS repeat protein, partial [Alphaproteobacteria bacterium]
MSVTSADGRTLAFTYSGYRIVGVEDPEGRDWTFTYDSGKLREIGYPHASGDPAPTRKFAYESGGTYNIAKETDLNLVGETDGDGKDWTWTYGTGQEMLTATDPVGTTKRYDYHSSYTRIYLYEYADGNPSAVHTTDRTRVHNYSSGLIASTVDEAGFSDSKIYDTDRNVTQYTDRRGKQWEYEYSGMGNVQEVTNPLGKTWEYTYTSLNDIATKTDPLGNVTVYSWSSGKLTKITDSQGTLNSYDNWVFTHNGYGDVLTKKDALNRTTTYGYNSQADVDSVLDPAGVEASASYDLLGRIEWMKDDALNQTSLAYDALGRVTELIRPGGATVAFTYDGEGRLLTSEDEIGRVAATTYDAL